MTRRTPVDLRCPRAREAAHCRLRLSPSAAKDALRHPWLALETAAPSRGLPSWLREVVPSFKDCPVRLAGGRA